MRINSELRKSVAFVGYVRRDLAGEDEFHPGGTGFFLNYEGVTYFVTARHVAEALEPPFALRATTDEGETVMWDTVAAGWFAHHDENVDIAIVAGVPPGVRVLGSSLILTPEKAAEHDIGVGDEVHIIGLYRLLHGRTKNQPIVHSGHLAMLPEDERIRQRDQRTGAVRDVEAYLVEAQTLEGLSGSPVFVRNTLQIPGRVNREEGRGRGFLLGGLHLLGIWSGAWDSPPGEVLAQERPGAGRVPVGMGLTVPSYKLLELLEMPRVVEHRAGLIAQRDAANQDAALVAEADEPVAPADQALPDGDGE